MKTPEQMADEYADDKSKAYYIGENGEKKWYITPGGQHSKEGFLAGYQAAMNSPEKQDSCEHILDMEKMVDVDKVMFCVYCNDMHKGDCAVGKGKNHPALTQPQWISVKDRLPPPQTEVLWWNKAAHQAGVSSWEYMSYCDDTMIYWGDAGNVSIKKFTYWMPLPEPPKEEE
jgi:hypothetical protein